VLYAELWRTHQLTYSVFLGVRCIDVQNSLAFTVDDGHSADSMPPFDPADTLEVLELNVKRHWFPRNKLIPGRGKLCRLTFI
jgi:hypothetical protein